MPQRVHSRERPCRPRVVLAELPTPVERLDALGAACGVEDLWVKRDDRSSPDYGGNKVRKLEYVLAQAQASGAERLLTLGAVGSHHVVATACFGRRLGLDTQAVVVPQPPSARVAQNLALGLGWGVRYRFCPHPALLPLALAREQLARPSSFLIPPGGSTPTGALGYVDAALELAEQIRGGTCPHPRLIVVASGSGGTHAGLVVGLALAGLEVPVLGIRVVPSHWLSERHVAALAAATARLVGMSAAPWRWRSLIRLASHHLGPGYGHPTAESARLIELAWAREGLVLEPTYTAKALAGALAAARLSTGTVLYWHTADGQDEAPPPSAGDWAALPAAIRRFAVP